MFNKVPNRLTPTMDGFRHKSSFDIAIKEHPVIEERKPFVTNGDHPQVDAGTPRVNIAPSQERPHGTEDEDYSKKYSNQTVGP